MTPSQHAIRIGVVMVAAGALLGWVVRHSEPTFADGLRYIHHAERIEHDGFCDGFFSGADHPLHAVAVTVAHRVCGGSGPASWQRAALALSYACAVLLVIPVYLLSLELFAENTAWVACLLTAVNPVVDDIVVNVLSESSFLLWWTFGLWCSVRFLRDGRLVWVFPAIGLGGLAYLTRPEGMLLPVALAATWLVSPLWRVTRITWPKWWRALAVMAMGPAIVAGPYVALKGGVGTKPGIARVLGLAAEAKPLDLERGKPVPAGQSTLRTYRLATVRMVKAFRVGVTTPLFPLALVGLVLAVRRPARARVWLFLAIVLGASAFALVRLHATGGYCTARHGLVPGMLLTMAAAFCITTVVQRLSIPGRWFGLVRTRLPFRPIFQGAVVGFFLIMSLKSQDLGPLNQGPYSVYHAASDWLRRHSVPGERVLDVTGWPLYFSALNGYGFANVYQAPADPATRWIVVRQPHVQGHWYYSGVIRDLIGGRTPAAIVPPRAEPHQVQILIYDRLAPVPQLASTSDRPGTASRGR